MTCCGGKKDPESPSFHPIKPRGCTDLLCLLIFFIFWAVLIFLGAFSFVIGNPMRLLHGYDSFGNICGMKNEPLGNLSFSGMDMTDRKFLFYLNTADVSRSLQLCVQKCPTEYIESEGQLVEYHRKTNNSLCRYDVSSVKEGSILYPKITNKSLVDAFRSMENKGYGPCPKLPVYPSKSLLNRCVPESVRGLGKDVVYSIYGYLNSFDVIQQVVSDLYATRVELIIMIAASTVLSVIMVFMIHLVASLVSWIIMAVVCVASLAVSVVLWWTYVDIKLGLDSTPFEELLEESAKNERAFLTYAILSTIITLIIFCLVFVLRKRVHLVVDLFREAGKCISTMPCLLTQPLWTFVFLVLFFFFWLAILVAMATAVYPMKVDRHLALTDHDLSQPTSNSSDKSLSADGPSISEARMFSTVQFKDATAWVHHMWWFHLIGLVWISEFILGCQQMVIAGAVASWYFCRDRSTLNCAILRSTWRLVSYHLGSVALGSFLITLFKVPRIILLFVQAKLDKYKDNALISCCLKCCHCCLFCLEKFLKYLNHNAYTVIAIESVGFCPASKTAFQTLVMNALRVATINSVGDFILFLGKCAVTALTAFIGILLMKHNSELHFYAIPVFLGCIFAFFIAHCVLSVYEMVIDTMFLCFCEDFNKNDGTEGKEFYAPESFLKYMMKDSPDGLGEGTPLRAVKATPYGQEPQNESEPQKESTKEPPEPVDV